MRSSLPMVLLVLVGCTGLAWPQLITSFETQDSLKVSIPGGTQIERVKEHATDGEWAIKVFFPGSERDSWPGFTFRPTEDTSKYHVLAMDVYNPGPSAVSLSMRIDPVEGGSQFSSEQIPPKTTKHVQYSVSGMGPVRQFFPYAMKPRTSYTLYFDNLRWENFDDRFTAIHYLDNTAQPVPSDAERKQGLVLFSRPWTDLVFANTRPLPTERISSLDLFATPGEYEAANLAVYALEDLKSVKVSFQGIPATGEVLPIRYMNKRVTYSDKRYTVGMPSECERRSEVDVARDTSRRWLLDLQVNADAQPGAYEGSVVLQRANGAEVTLPLRLRVLPYRLQEPQDMYWGEYYVRPRFAKDDAEVIALLRPHMTDMRQHGMTSVGLCFGPPTANAKFLADGTCQLNLDGTSPYEKFMDLYKELKYPAPVVLLSDSGQSAASQGAPTAARLSPEWDRCYKSYWIAMQQEHKKRGWAEVIVQPVDEPGWQSREDKDRNVHCLKLLKQIPGMRTEQDGPGDDYFHNEAGPYADLWNYNGAISSPQVVSKAQGEGRTVLLYNCDVESYRPEVDRYTAGWFQLRSGASGCYNWAYISYGGTPYNDQDHSSGDWMHVYPPMPGEPGGPSTGWTGAREGIDDYKYAYTLRQAIRRAEASANPTAKRAATEAQAEYDALLTSIDYSPSVRGRAAWTQTGADAEGNPTVAGTLKLPNGWEHADYDRARWRVAMATWNVLAALGDVQQLPSPQIAATGPRAGLVSDVRWTTAPQAPATTVSAGRQVTIPIWTQGPALDGDLTDAIWAKAARLDPFTINTGRGTPQQATDVLVGADSKNLYVAATCHEDNIAHLTAKVTRDGENVWEDDCLELFIDPTLSRSQFRQVIVNPLGVQSWNNSVDRKWRAASVAKAKVGTDRWTVEWALPLADLGLTGGQFGLNVCRERRPMETLELSCWAPTGGSFGQPDRFGVASFGQSWIGDFKVAPARLGSNEFTVAVRNETRTAQSVLPMLFVGGAAKGQALETSPIALQPGATVSKTYRYTIASEPAPSFTFRLTAAGTGTVLAERTFTPTLPPTLKMTVRPRTFYLSENAGAVQLEVNLSESLRSQARVEVGVYATGQTTPLAKATLAQITGDRAEFALNVTGLPVGSYVVKASLASGDRVLSEATAPLQRVRGPFD